MSAKYTPGPWETAGSGITVWSLDEMVADCSPEDGEIPTSERQANARLIASAPELLEALEATVLHVEMPLSGRDADWHEAGTDILNRARTAIAKARGES